jgi:hypothetical protein
VKGALFIDGTSGYWMRIQINQSYIFEKISEWNSRRSWCWIAFWFLILQNRFLPSLFENHICPKVIVGFRPNQFWKWFMAQRKFNFQFAIHFNTIPGKKRARWFRALLYNNQSRRKIFFCAVSTKYSIV